MDPEDIIMSNIKVKKGDIVVFRNDTPFSDINIVIGYLSQMEDMRGKTDIVSAANSDGKRFTTVNCKLGIIYETSMLGCVIHSDNTKEVIYPGLTIDEELVTKHFEKDNMIAARNEDFISFLTNHKCLARFKDAISEATFNYVLKNTDITDSLSMHGSFKLAVSANKIWETIWDQWNKFVITKHPEFAEGLWKKK